MAAAEEPPSEPEQQTEEQKTPRLVFEKGKLSMVAKGITELPSDVIADYSAVSRELDLAHNSLRFFLLLLSIYYFLFSCFIFENTYRYRRIHTPQNARPGQ